MLTVVIPAWNGEDCLPDCLRSLEAQSFKLFDLVIVDNGSSDQTIQTVKRSNLNVHLITNERNLGVARAWNTGIRYDDLQSEFYLLLNQDMTLASQCVEALLKTFKDISKVGIVGAKLFYPSTNRIQHVGGKIDWARCTGYHPARTQVDDGQYDLMSEVDYVTGACMMISREIFNDLSGFDEWFSPAYFEDVDFCLRGTQSGYGCWYAPNAVGYHSHPWPRLRLPELHKWLLKQVNHFRFAAKHLPLRQLLDEFFRLERVRYAGILEEEVILDIQTLGYSTKLAEIYMLDWNKELSLLDVKRREIFYRGIQFLRDSILQNAFTLSDEERRWYFEAPELSLNRR